MREDSRAVNKSKRSTLSTYLLTFTPILSVQMHIDLHADVRMCDSAWDPTFNQRTHASLLVLPCPEGQQLENGKGGIGDKIDTRVPVAVCHMSRQLHNRERKIIEPIAKLFPMSSASMTSKGRRMK